MSTACFRENLHNESVIDRLPPRQRPTIWKFARTTILFVSLVGLLAIVVGSPNDRPTTIKTMPAFLSESTQAASEPAKTKRARAISIILPIGDSGVSGTLQLIDLGDEIEIRGVIQGLTPGKHGFHIHVAVPKLALSKTVNQA